MIWIAAMFPKSYNCDKGDFESALLSFSSESVLHSKHQYADFRSMRYNWTFEILYILGVNPDTVSGQGTRLNGRLITLASRWLQALESEECDLYSRVPC